MIHRRLISVFVFAVMGCAPVVPAPPADGILLQAILPPDSLGRDLSLSQEVVGEFRDQRHALRVEVEITSTRLVMVALTHLGVPVFSLEQNGDRVHVEALGAAQLPFNPRHILSDFQIAHWPASVLRDRFRSFGLGLADASSDGSRKVFSESGALLVEVTYGDAVSSAGDIVIEHFDHPYRLHIRTFATSDLD